MTTREFIEMVQSYYGKGFKIADIFDDFQRRDDGDIEKLIHEHVRYAPYDSIEPKRTKTELHIYVESFSNDEVRIAIDTAMSELVSYKLIKGYPQSAIMLEMIDWIMQQRGWTPEESYCMSYDIKNYYGHIQT